MDKHLSVTESSYSFEDLFTAENISEETKGKLTDDSIVAIPGKYSEGEYYFAQETIEFIKFCRENDKDHSIELLAEGDIKVRSLHSFDIWMPVLWIATEILLPLAVGLVTNYLYDKMKGREHEDAKVDLTVIIGSGKNKKEIRYNGDAKTFKDTFEKIDINKL